MSFPEENKQELLKVINDFRAKHSAPPLEWDDSIAQEAQSWADQGVFKHGGFGHNEGQNLAAGSAGMTMTDLAQGWIDEEANYDWNKPGYSSSTGHFTALVWKSTTKVGAGGSVIGSGDMEGMYFLVCNFSPAGNMNAPGYFEKNVLPPIN